MNDQKSYKGIFKATFLFGSVQVFTILVNVVKKIITFLLGTRGFGIIGLFSSYNIFEAIKVLTNFKNLLLK
jgi:hypothetical protein